MLLFLRKLPTYLGLIAWTAYMGWSVWTQSGLYEIIVQKQLDWFGEVYELYPEGFVWLFGTLPIIIVLSGLYPGPLVNMEPSGPVTEDSENAKMRKAGAYCFVLALLIAGGAVGMYFYADTLPDGTDAAITLNIAKGLPEGLDRNAKVLLDGDRYSNLGTIITTTGDNSKYDTHYVPVVPTDADPRSTPIQFVEVFETRDTTAQVSTDEFFDEGYLTVYNPPVIVREGFAAAGLRFAETVYAVESSDSSPQETWRTGSYVVGGIAGLMVLMALYLAIPSRKKKTVI